MQILKDGKSRTDACGVLRLEWGWNDVNWIRSQCVEERQLQDICSMVVGMEKRT